MVTAQAEALEPKAYKLTVEEYSRMAKIGIFDGKRVELIEGEVIEMSAMGRPHVIALNKTADLLKRIFADGWFVQTQAPLRFGKRSEPEPDIAVIKGKMEDYPTDHPTTADLIIEVSDQTLNYDRKRKASLYAKAGIQDYWVLNLKKHQLEIFRRPVPDAEARHGFSYEDQQVVKESESVSPLIKPDAAIAVADLLPPTNYR
ncbi:MAG TPA: Uma2 family endonuclease [Blastocatellia bacterium]|nr:Uma2 family endonuclease [Blastocatellia bacterium]HMV82577.1 Uma2 family endonuclease [Blastocatellia bacterium]HMX26182.1 Uma2 family endonuclease [Blastocatellia bacterium]HMY73682.1 Uma2 family endonuclease [Blastocatellia bacterium]HMZ22787.1 Uma2 family endonuclease [Blastocatellia bacterium]